MQNGTIKLMTWNVNGIRAVDKKGALREMLERENPDVLFFNEIKGTVDKFPAHIVSPDDYHAFYHSAEKAGYAGTGVWIKKDPKFEVEQFFTGLDNRLDPEGRVSQLILKVGRQKLHLLGIYFPNGGKSPEAFDDKLLFYEDFLATVNRSRNEGNTCIWTGDVNCAHEEIDLARPKENEKSIGFLPVERAWVSKVISQEWVDVFRSKYPDKQSYTWWNLQTRSRERNVGWRIDYFFLDISLFDRVIDIAHLTQQMGSDHCPVALTFRL